MDDDGVDYLCPVGNHWGEFCGSLEAAGRWADELVSTLRSCWSDPNPGGYLHGATACLSCLLLTPLARNPDASDRSVRLTHKTDYSIQDAVL